MSSNNKLKSPPRVLDSVTENLKNQVSGILTTRRTAKYTSGARTILKINGEIVGFAFSINWNIRLDVNEIRTIDDYLPAELVPTMCSVTGSIGALHIPGASPTKKQYMAHILSFLQHPYITIEVRDSATDALLFYTAQAMIVNKSESLQAEELGRMTLDFKAIGWLDEMTPNPVDPGEPAGRGGTKNIFDFDTVKNRLKNMA